MGSNQVIASNSSKIIKIIITSLCIIGVFLLVNIIFINEVDETLDFLEGHFLPKNIDRKKGYKNEPGGFRGIAFGTEYSRVQGMQYSRNCYSFIEYTRKNEERLFGIVSPDKVVYQFFDGIFGGVSVEFKNYWNFFILKRLLKVQHGNPKIIDPRNVGSDEFLIWTGRDVNTVLEYNNKTRTGNFRVFNVPIIK